MGWNTSTYANDGIGAGCNEKFAQEGFEASASNGVKGVFCRLLASFFILLRVLLKNPCSRKNAIGSVHLVCVPANATLGRSW